MTNDPKMPISKAFDTPASDETPEVEGHMPRVRFGPPEQAAEVEGHGYRGPAVPEQPSTADETSSASDVEVEGHALNSGRAVPETSERDDETSGEASEVEGHAIKAHRTVE